MMEQQISMVHEMVLVLKYVQKSHKLDLFLAMDMH